MKIEEFFPAKRSQLQKPLRQHELEEAEVADAGGMADVPEVRRVNRTTYSIWIGARRVDTIDLAWVDATFGQARLHRFIGALGVCAETKEQRDAVRDFRDAWSALAIEVAS